MRTAQVLSTLCLFLFLALSSFAQASYKVPAIQLAAYDNWQQLENNKHRFVKYFNKIDWPEHVYTVADLRTERVGKWVRVFLLHENWQVNDLLLTIQAQPYFKDAFFRNVRKGNLMAYATPAAKSTGTIPSEFTAKGKMVASKNDASKYKIQLGVFKEKKSFDYIVSNYGLDMDDVEYMLSHDFTTVKNKVCRRYYFGSYDNKADARAMLWELEGKTNKKLLLKKIKG